MKEILLTGYSKKEFLKIIEKEEKGACYLCKRKVNDKGVFLIKDGEEEGSGSCELGLEFVEVIKDGNKFKFPLCQECKLLLESFAERINFPQGLFERLSLN